MIKLCQINYTLSFHLYDLFDFFSKFFFLLYGKKLEHLIELGIYKGNNTLELFYFFHVASAFYT